VLLFGFLGLAVDGGRLYSENRRAQHAADNAAMTGALYIGKNYQILESQDESASRDCSGGGILCLSQRTGEIALGSAGFLVSDYLVGYDIVVQPSPYGGIKYVDVSVDLEVEIDPYFAKVFTDQPLRTKVFSEARVYPTQNFAFGYSMISTSETICDGITIEGSSTTILQAGGLHSNTADPNCDAVRIQGATGILVDITGPFTGSSTLGTIGNPVVTSTDPYIGDLPPFTLPDITPPECVDPPLSHTDDGAGTLTYYPGNQYDMSFESSGTIINFEPGIYCVHGGMKILGGTFYGPGVLFYIVSGDVDISANAELHVSAPTGGVSDINGKTIYDGLLIYSNPETTGKIFIAGNAGSEMSGTIYAPGPPPVPQPKCEIIGDSVTEGDSISLGLQLICSTIKVSGNGSLNLSFNEDLLYSPPPVLGLLH
jgi:hypothetical protein